MTTATKDRQQESLTKFVEVYWRRHRHAAEAGSGLCTDCADLLAYASARLARCPLDPKPRCKDCRVHCYKPEYRQRMREVMRFSGLYFVKRGRVDWLVKYFLGR